MKEKRFIKDKKDVSNEYLKELRKLFLESPEEIFKNKAVAWRDFDYFNGTTDREHLVMPDELIIIDRLDDANEHSNYTICKIKGWDSEKKPRVSHLWTICKVRDVQKFKNGYFLLPKIK